MSIGKNSLARAAAATAGRTPAAEESKAPAQLRQVEVAAILPLRGKRLTATADEALVASVRTHGVLEPLLLAQTAADELRVISGARRLAAARQAGLATVPAVIVEMTAEKAVACKKELTRFAATVAPETGTVETTAVGQAMPAWLL